jgi:hypothetical protein
LFGFWEKFDLKKFFLKIPDFVSQNKKCKIFVILKNDPLFSHSPGLFLYCNNIFPTYCLLVHDSERQNGIDFKKKFADAASFVDYFVHPGKFVRNLGKRVLGSGKSYRAEHKS